MIETIFCFQTNFKDSVHVGKILKSSSVEMNHLGIFSGLLSLGTLPHKLLATLLELGVGGDPLVDLAGEGDVLDLAPPPGVPHCQGLGVWGGVTTTHLIIVLIIYKDQIKYFH